MRLLLVEDDAALGEELARLLRRADFAVDRATTAREAEEAGRSSPMTPSCSISDCRMATGLKCSRPGGRKG